MRKPGDGAAGGLKTDVVGLDFGASGIKAVRLRRRRAGIALLAVDVLPLPPSKSSEARERLILPPALAANYAAVCLNGDRSSIRLLDLPALPNVKIEDQIQQQFNLTGDYRMGYAIIPIPGVKDTLRTLAVALPEDEAQATLARLAVGPPAPTSLEYPSLAALHAFERGVGARHAQEAVGVLDAGSRFTHLFLFLHGRLALARRFEAGGANVLERVRSQMDLDEATALNVLSTGAIDLSAVYHEALSSVFKQLAISRDFVERREHCRVARLYLAGGLSISTYWEQTVSEATGVPCTVWNPMEGLTEVGGEFPVPWRGQEPRFAAALGAALGNMLAHEHPY